MELKKELRGGASIDNKLVLVKSKGPTLIRVQAGSAQNVDAASYRENPPGDVEPILLPWGEVEARGYRWDGTHFARVQEKKRAIPAGVQAAREAPDAPSMAHQVGARQAAQQVDNAIWRRARSSSSTSNAMPRDSSTMCTPMLT